jgi:anti-sigma factor RsiW
MDSDHLLMAYADGELDATAASQVELRTANDPRARARLEMYRETTSLLRSACGESLYAPSTPMLTGRRGGPRPTRRHLGMTIAAGVGLGLLGFGVGRLLPDAEEPDLLSEVAEYHEVISRETSHLVERPASRTGEEVAWLGARIARRLIAPDLTSSSLRFAGVRLLVFDGRPLADLLYTREHGPPVGLCVARLPGDAQPIRLAPRDGLQLATWRDDGYAYVVVGELDEQAARDIAERAAVQLRG